MASRVATIILIALFLLIQGQLWFGRGSLRQVSVLQDELLQQQQANDAERLHNDQLISEVEDLKRGLGTVEEKARMELGMVRPNEIFVQVVPNATEHPEKADQKTP